MNSSKLPLAVTFAIRIAIASALSGLAYWKMGGLVVFMLSVPVWGALLAAPIVELLANYFNFARKQPYAAWQGQYYEFQGAQVRIFEIDGALWFCDCDVLHILGKKPERTMRLTYSEADYRKIEHAGLMAFSETAVLRVISRIRHPEIGKLKFWIEREVIAPYHKKRELKGLSGSHFSDKKS